MINELSRENIKIEWKTCMGLYLAYIRGYDWFPNFEKPKIDL
jgi:hypothetical protein